MLVWKSGLLSVAQLLLLVVADCCCCDVATLRRHSLSLITHSLTPSLTHLLVGCAE
jgi:hypothetical protein